MPHVLEFRQKLLEIISESLVLVGDDDLISSVFDKSRFLFLSNFFMACHLLKFVYVRLMVNKFDDLAKRWIHDVQGRLITLIMFNFWERGDRCQNSLMLRKD